MSAPDVTPTDILKKLAVGSVSNGIAVTFRFNGGPIVVNHHMDGATAKTLTFSGDPFFKQRGHYISAGSLIFKDIPNANEALLLTVQFVNMFRGDDKPKEVMYRLEVSLMTSCKSLLSLEDVVPIGMSTNIVLSIGV